MQLFRRLAATLGLLSALIGIFVFMTGKFTYVEAAHAFRRWYSKTRSESLEGKARARASTLRRIQAQIEIDIAGYNRMVAEVIGGRATIEQLVDRVRTLERDLIVETAEDGLSTLDRMSEVDRLQLAERVSGVRLWYHESVGVELNPAFFLYLAQRHGDDADRQFFLNYRLTFPEGYHWPEYLQQQTDVAGCVRFGSGTLVEDYERWSSYRYNFPGRYVSEVHARYTDVASELTQGTCACGNSKDVVRELSQFVAQFPNSDITSRVTERLNAIVAGKSDVRFNCIGG